MRARIIRATDRSRSAGATRIARRGQSVRECLRIHVGTRYRAATRRKVLASQRDEAAGGLQLQWQLAEGQLDGVSVNQSLGTR
jgi:hypothetical protein